MSTPAGGYKVSVAVFFWLNLPEPILMEVLKDAGFSEVVSRLPSLPIAPGVQVVLSPSRRLVASYKSVKVNWDSAKFMLSFEGDVEDVVEALESVMSSFDRHGYPPEEVCHYYEVSFAPQPLDIGGFVSNLRGKANIELKVGNEVLRPFSISFSNFEAPISRERFYKWFHITVTPDVNAPQRRVFVQIIKRDTDLKSTLNFLKNIGKILQYIREFFTG